MNNLDQLKKIWVINKFIFRNNLFLFSVSDRNPKVFSCDVKFALCVLKFVFCVFVCNIIFQVFFYIYNFFLSVFEVFVSFDSYFF